MDLTRRSHHHELMDVEPAGSAEIDRTLRELSTINRLTLAYRPTLHWLDRVVARHTPERMPLSILDVACGHGDMLRRVWAWARQRRVPVILAGLDKNPEVVRSAAAATPPEAPIRYELGDVFAAGEDGPGPDVIISSLFAHHLFDDALVGFVDWMERRARCSWLVNDLHRHPIPYHFVKNWVRLAGFGQFVAHDAPVSVARGFTREDWREVVAQSGVDPGAVEISWHVPFRYLVGRIK